MNKHCQKHRKDSKSWVSSSSSGARSRAPRRAIYICSMSYGNIKQFASHVHDQSCCELGYGMRVSPELTKPKHGPLSWDWQKTADAVVLAQRGFLPRKLVKAVEMHILLHLQNLLINQFLLLKNLKIWSSQLFLVCKCLPVVLFNCSF